MHIESIQTSLVPQKGATACKASEALRVTGRKQPLIKMVWFVVTSPQVYDIASYGDGLGREHVRRRIPNLVKGCDRCSSTNRISEGPSFAYSYGTAAPRSSAVRVYFLCAE